MEFWYTEEHTKNVRFSIRVEQQVYSGQSMYQRIDVFDSQEFGRFLTLDGFMMVTERDEFIYHEMIVHVALAVNPEIKKVLVIGGGDGGTVRELCKYASIEEIHLVEIDQDVISVSQQFLPQTAEKLTDPRVHIFIEDGLRYVRNKVEAYDLIIVDSTDPFGPGEGLFTKAFYGNCYKALSKDGILINQHESPYYAEDAKAMMRAHKRLYETFPIAKVYQAHLPTYPSGHWLFGFASKGLHPTNDLQNLQWSRLKLKTKYYNTRLHQGCFALPTYVTDLLKQAENSDE